MVEKVLVLLELEPLEDQEDQVAVVEQNNQVVQM